MGDSRLPQQGEGGLHDAECGLEILPVRADDGVLPAVVGPKQLVGTIEEVDTHRPDPTTDGEVDPWDAVTLEWTALKDRLRDTYRDLASDEGPSEEEIKAALATLAGAWDQVAASFSAAMGNPDTRAQLKKAAGSLATALGATVSGLGEEIRRPEESDGQPADNG